MKDKPLSKKALILYADNGKEADALMDLARRDEREEFYKLLEENIKRNYESLLYTRGMHNHNEIWAEGFRNRVDELILIWHIIKDISFVDACKELNIKYQDLQ